METWPKTERVVHFVDGGEVHCALNDPSLKHQIEFDWLDDIFNNSEVQIGSPPD
jgi:hypothetical protein